MAIYKITKIVRTYCLVLEWLLITSGSGIGLLGVFCFPRVERMGSLWLACIFGLDKSVNDIFRLCVYCVVITTVVQNGQTQTKKKTHTKKKTQIKKRKHKLKKKTQIKKENTH